MSRLDFTGVEPPTPVRERLCEWFQKHGVDPKYIPLYSWIERDEEAFRIRYQVFVQNLIHYPKWSAIIDFSQGEALVREKTAQLEAKPLPFPDFSEWGIHEET